MFATVHISCCVGGLSNWTRDLTAAPVGLGFISPAKENEMTFPIGGALPALFLFAAVMATAVACASEPKSLSIVTVEHPAQSLVIAGFEREVGYEI